MGQEDAIGVVRAHRWATLEEQRARLKADGVRAIIDLGTTERDYLLGAVREGGTVIKLAFAFLLTNPDKGAVRALADYRGFACKLARVVHAHHKVGRVKAKTVTAGWVKDLETGLVANTPGTRKAMLAVVKDQLARHGKGKRSADNGTRGRQAVVLNELQDAKGKAIWLDRRRYPEWKDAERALREQVHKRITRWRAHRLWGPREIGAKATGRSEPSVRCIIQWGGNALSRKGPRWWHQPTKAFGLNMHAATVFETKAAAEAEREANNLSPHTTHIVAAPQRYMTGSLQGFARRGLRRVT